MQSQQYDTLKMQIKQLPMQCDTIHIITMQCDLISIWFDSAQCDLMQWKKL